MDGEAIRFGAFVLLPAQRRLLRDGAALPLGARAMDLLLTMTARPGIVLSKDELLRSVWPGRVVEENNLTVHMAALRRALGDLRDGQSLIQTVTGRGYMFIGANRTQPLEEAPAPAAPSPASVPRVAVPQPATRLVGRDAALQDLRQWLGGRRVVTIVGPGGVGKTALALQAAADSAALFPDGATFADLSGITDPARVAESVAALVAGGAGSNTAIERLTLFLRDRRSLLVLDNCDRLVDPVAALVKAVLAACPGVVILVTSREGLFLSGEQIFRLPPLSVPAGPDTVTAATALTYDAVRLFVERAEAMGGFALDDANAPVVARICVRLDGIPLAIEMAAARLKVLSPAQLFDRLDERFRLLAAPGRWTTPRHRTLQAMIDWSYDFLPAEEQVLLRGLSTFSGGAGLAAIQAVAGEAAGNEWELLDHLTGLADKSLVTVDPAAEPRFRLLETIRHYATAKMVEAGETGSRGRHAAYFADRFSGAAAAWPTLESQQWLATYAEDADNLRAALTWAFGPDGDVGIGLRLVASSVPLWWELPGTPVGEGQRWIGAGSGRLAPETPDAVRGWIRLGQSWRDFRFGDRENLPAALDAAALFRACGDTMGLGAALWRAGSAQLTLETAGAAQACLTEAEVVLRGVPPSKWLALTLIRLGDLRFRQGRHTEARAAYQEGFALSRTTRFWIGLVNGGSNLAELMFTQGESEPALRQLRRLRDELPPSRRTPLMATLAAHLLVAGETADMRLAAEEAIAQGAAIGLTAALAWTIEAVALLAAREGDAASAGRLAGYARAVHPSVATRAGSRKAVVEQLDQALATALSPAERETALAEGAGWTAATATERARLVLWPDRAAGG